MKILKEKIKINEMTTNTFIEVCAGAGGLSSGFMKAGWMKMIG